MGRKNRQRKPEPIKCCETCANMQPIGEGDHICDACCSHDGSPTALVLESYIPADDYFICEGSRWTRRYSNPEDHRAAGLCRPQNCRIKQKSPGGCRGSLSLSCICWLL